MVETEHSRPRETLPTVQFGGGPIMLWGHGPSAGTGSLIKVEGRMDSSQRTVQNTFNQNPDSHWKLQEAFRGC